MLEALRKANPHLPLYAVTDPAFAPYGKVLSGDTSELYDALRQTDIPAEGNCYVASDAGLEAVDVIAHWQRTVYGAMAVQAGYCNGNGNRLNAMEYHKSSEVNFSDTGLVLLLALQSDLNGGRLRSADVKGFYLPPRAAVEIRPEVLHFAPLPGAGSGLPVSGGAAARHQRAAGAGGRRAARRGGPSLDAEQMDDLPPGFAPGPKGRLRGHRGRKPPGPPPRLRNETSESPTGRCRWVFFFRRTGKGAKAVE